MFSRKDAHEYNMDAAQRDLDRRAMEGEDMSQAFIDVDTYEIIKEQIQDNKLYNKE